MQRKKSSEADYNDFEKYVYPIENFELEESLLEPAKQLISYYREYPSEFVKEYLGLMTYDFQTVLLNEMMWSSHVINMECRNLRQNNTNLFIYVL